MPHGGDGDEAGLPVIDADAAPIGRPSVRHGSLGRRPTRTRGVLPAVAALVVLTAGVALGGILETSEPEASPSPGASAAIPTPTGACEAAATTRVPEFELILAGAPDGGVPGIQTSAHRPGRTSPSRGWLVPRLGGSTLAAPVEHTLTVRAEPGICFRFLNAVYATAILPGTPAPEDRTRLTYGGMQPPEAEPSLGRLPAGDWVLQVTAYFWTGIEGTPGEVHAQRAFRVMVGEGPFPTLEASPTAVPTPAVTPDVACGPAPASAEDVIVTATAPGGDAIPGGPPAGDPPVVTMSLGDVLGLAVLDARCATSWDVRILSEDGADVVDRETRQNPGEDPGWAAQNHWRLVPGMGTFRLLVDLHFGATVQVTRVWLLNVPAFTVPRTVLIGADGSTVEALPGCGLSLQLVNGYTTGDTCGSIGFPDGLEVLRVPAWSAVRLEVDGWQISSWYGSCGRVVTDGGIEAFEPADGCGLGGYYVEPGQDPPAAAIFLARPGEHVVQIGLTGSLNGNTYNVPMYAIVRGE